MTKHTKTPVSLKPYSMELLAGLGFTIIDADGEMLATAVREPYASEIANAINLHDELVTALEAIEAEWLERGKKMYGGIGAPSAIFIARAILKRCQKEKKNG